MSIAICYLCFIEMVKIASLVNIIILLRALEKKNVPDFSL